MVKSPVEGNDIVLLKLEDPVVFSGIVFSVCLSNLKRKVHLNLLKKVTFPIDFEALRVCERTKNIELYN